MQQLLYLQLLKLLFYLIEFPQKLTKLSLSAVTFVTSVTITPLQHNPARGFNLTNKHWGATVTVGLAGYDRLALR